MRKISGSTWECTECGKQIWLGRGSRPEVQTVAIVGGRRRIVTVDLEIVHECDVDANIAVEDQTM